MEENFIEQEFLEYVLGSILENKEALSINGKKDELGILYEISVSPDDMGKLIGKGGQTIKALKMLLRTMGSKRNQRVNLKVLEPA